MALDPTLNFPGQIDPPTAGFPNGKARDVTLPDDGTGTPYNALKINDDFGFYAALLDAVGDTPSGVPDEVGTSQYLDAINTLIASAQASALQTLYPVGEIYITLQAGTPDTWLGFGTWTAFGAGRTLVGLDTGDVDFDAAEETGGFKTHTLTEAEMPSHDHTINEGAGFPSGPSILTEGEGTGTSAVLGTQDTTSTGGGSAHNNLQPYITVFFWKRTA